MFDFTTNSADKNSLYADLLSAADAVTAGEGDGVANMANVAALLMQFLPDCNWTGFYRMVDDTLVLGPFQGSVACTRIAKGRGVCGTAWSTKEIQLVPDVDLFPGHIACSSASRSEIVVPILVNGEVWGVLDVDSDVLNDFDQTDVTYLSKICAWLGSSIL